MGLTRWDQPTDLFSYTELSDNFNDIDLHDHTSGKGVAIPTAGIDNLAVTEAKIANSAVTVNKVAAATLTDAKLASPNNGVYRTIFTATGAYAVATANTYLIRSSDLIATLPASAVAMPPAALYLDDADYTVANKSAVLNLRVQHFQNNVAPAITFTYEVRPLTIGTGTSSGLTFTVGSTLATVNVASPAANSATSVATADFAFPTDGHYAITVTSSGTPAANNISLFNVHLRLRHV